jgi:hypothetical protein
MRRLCLIFAALAALLGAPSLASAAGNALAAPSATPTSGTVTTVFTLRVTYDGKFPATAVSVSVAGLSLPMARVSGTPLQGTWSVDTLLPAGTWVPAFSSLADRGNAAFISGPAISVAGPGLAATPVPTQGGPTPRTGIDTGDPSLPADPGDGTDPGGVPAEGGPDPESSADPRASAAGAPSPGDASGGEDPAGPAGPAAPRGGTDAGEAGDDDPAAAPTDGSRPAASTGAGGRVRGSGQDSGTPAAIGEDEGVASLLLIGLSGVALLASIGTALLLLGRRRAATTEGDASAPSTTDTDALLERRALRQAKVRLTEDPIVAAMGIDDEVAVRRRRRHAATIAGGTRERPKRPRR